MKAAMANMINPTTHFVSLVLSVPINAIQFKLLKKPFQAGDKMFYNAPKIKRAANLTGFS
jgi:hypothetical protein